MADTSSEFKAVSGPDVALAPLGSRNSKRKPVGKPERLGPRNRLWCRGWRICLVITSGFAETSLSAEGSSAEKTGVRRWKK